MHVPAQPLAIETKTTRRAHDEAVLQACNQLQENEEEKGKTLWIADKLKLRSFAIIDAHDVEHNALIHEANLSRILGQDLPTTLISTLPAKHKRECSCHSNNEATDDPKTSILSTTGNWKYQEKLLDRKHVELSEEIAEMLNEDWKLRPQMKFFCAQLFSGSILVQGMKALLINCVEAYERTKQVDSQRENFTNKNGIPPPTSLKRRQPDTPMSGPQ
jgi:hypothetical protein